MQKYIKWQSIAPEIRMHRSKNKSQMYLIVEGTSDVKFFNNIVNKKTCKIKSVRGKENVLKVINELRKIKGMIAIVDSDFENILYNSCKNENILVTDTHDIETLILKTDSIEKFINEYGNHDEISELEEKWGKSLLDKVIEISYVIGCLRLISIKDKRKLNFQDLYYERFIDKELEIDVEEYVQQVLYNSHTPQTEKYTLINNIKKETERNHEKWQVCCGHDITEILALILSYDFNGKCLGNNSAKYLNASKVETALRLSYDYSKFNFTELYKDMMIWQTENLEWRLIPEMCIENVS